VKNDVLRLREAELEHDGNQLGPVGSPIVAEVFIGLLAADRLSYLNVEPSWKPDDDLGGAPSTCPTSSASQYQEPA